MYICLIFDMENKLIVFYVTFPDFQSARDIAKLLIQNKLAGCCNLIPNITSIYPWNNQIETSQECVLIIKTTEEKSKTLVEFIQTKHPYTVPCILNLQNGNINSSYFEWIKNSLNNS